MVRFRLIKLFCHIFTLFVLAWIIGCAGSSPKDDRDFESQFKKAKTLLEKKKYIRAQEEFHLLVLKASHTDIGDDALFYFGESYFLNKEYPLAISQYDRLIRKFEFSPYVEQARWRICESYVSESPDYYHDQENTNKALEKIQEFLDDYPSTEYRDEAQNTILGLRVKLGMKMYEVGVLYIKLRAFDSAIIAFDNMLDNYYDTPYAELAHVGIIRCHSEMLEVEKAQEYLELKKDILNVELQTEAERYIAKAHKRIEKAK